ncbi:MAG: hypothetical protein Athens101426_93 [Parcubacteria group bacterium Athens1014_26]|nr:MAG: hypothetical protein Athens101426_93 [Parcubacteria group bacterium Athens1014_26]
MTESPQQCGLCKTKTGFVLKEKFKEYSLWECPKCFGQFWFPMISPSSDWYEKDERYSFRNQNPLRKPERNHNEFLKDLPAQGGKLLDVGMGTGNFLTAAVNKGYDCYGDEAIKKFGNDYFDVVTMFEVLEHLDNPSDFIEKTKLLLKDEGYLALSVPYRRALDILKPHDKPPRHLTRWDEKAIKNFITERGFEIIRIKIIPVSLPYLITKFHFWFRGFLSFNLINKMAKENGAEVVLKKDNLKWLRKLARFKDYLFFGIPAVLFLFFLYASGRRGLGLYVLAKKV